MKIGNRKKLLKRNFLALGCLSVLGCSGNQQPISTDATNELTPQKNIILAEPDFDAEEFLKTQSSQKKSEEKEEIIVGKFIEHFIPEEDKDADFKEYPRDYDRKKLKDSTFTSNFVSFSDGCDGMITFKDGSEYHDWRHDYTKTTDIGCYKMDDGRWLVIKTENYITYFYGFSCEIDLYYYDGNSLTYCNEKDKILPKFSFDYYNDDFLLYNFTEEEKKNTTERIENKGCIYWLEKNKLKMNVNYMSNEYIGTPHKDALDASKTIKFTWNGKEFVHTDDARDEQTAVVGLGEVFKPEFFKNYQILKTSNGYNLIKNNKKHYTVFTNEQNKIDSIEVFTRQIDTDFRFTSLFKESETTIIGTLELGNVFDPKKIKKYRVEKINNGYKVTDAEDYFLFYTDKDNKIDSIKCYERHYSPEYSLGTKLNDATSNDYDSYSRIIKQITNDKFECKLNSSEVTIVDKKDITEKSLKEMKNGMINDPVYKDNAIITNLKIKHVEYNKNIY